MKGFKAFNRVEGNDNAGVCRGMLFEEGGEYTIQGDLKICSNGLHFCKYLVQTFEYYNFNHDSTIYAEVEATGNLDTEDVLAFKYATDKLKIIRFLTKEEVDAMFSDDKMNTGDYNTGNYNTGNRNTGNWNTGNRNTGNWNTGDYNTGNWNTGDYNTGNYNTGNRNTGNWNTGNRNTGNWNTGDYNTGNYNTGNRNTGNWNTGDWNTGDWNTGDWNTGDWNTSDRNSGFFNTEPVKTVKVFNIETDLELWENAKKPDFIYFNLLKGKSYKESFIESFNNADKKDVELLLKLPNFDYKVFEDISGITQQMIEEKLK